MNYEIIGIAGTIAILIAFLCNEEKYIRIVDAIGAMLFVVYGICIKSPSTVILNCALVAIQAVKLHKLVKNGL